MFVRNFAAVLIPPSLDDKQALRLQRFGVASLSYVLATVMVAIAWAFGALPASIVAQVAAAFLANNLLLYWVIRSGNNLRFEDPSLTRYQILSAITVVMYIVYNMDRGREAALFSCFIVFQFGIFRMSVREFAVVTLYTLAAYALVINLLLHFRPAVIPDVAEEWLSWLALAGFLPCMNLVGGQINTLRRNMRRNEATLRESEERFRLTFELAGSGMAHVDLEGRFLRVNRSLCAMLGYSEKELVARTVMELSHPEDRGITTAGRARMRMNEVESVRFHKRYVRKDGATIWIDLSVALVRDAEGRPLYEIAVFDDETIRRQAEQAARDSAAELRLFADNVPAMTASWDQNLRCRFASKAFAEFYGFTDQDVIGKHAREVLGEDVFQASDDRVVQMRLGHSVTFQRIRKLASGELRHLEIKLLPQAGAQGIVTGCFSVTTDITEHKLAEERIQRVADHDSLTGLPNRLLFNDRLNQAIAFSRRDARQFALLYLDLDRFKPVNDSLGHAAGDELLKSVAARIRRLVRETDTVARVGGDEFAVIVTPTAGRREAEIIAGKIVAALAAPFELGSPKRSIDIGVSIGVAVYPVDARTAEALVKTADADMYRVKRAA